MCRIRLFSFLSLAGTSKQLWGRTNINMAPDRGKCKRGRTYTSSRLQLTRCPSPKKYRTCCRWPRRRGCEPHRLESFVRQPSCNGLGFRLTWAWLHVASAAQPTRHTRNADDDAALARDGRGCPGGPGRPSIDWLPLVQAWQMYVRLVDRLAYAMTMKMQT